MNLYVKSVYFLKSLFVIIDCAIQIGIFKFDLAKFLLDPNLTLPKLVDLRFVFLISQYALLQLILVLEDRVLCLVVLPL